MAMMMMKDDWQMEHIGGLIVPSYSYMIVFVRNYVQKQQIIKLAFGRDLIMHLYLYLKQYDMWLAILFLNVTQTMTGMKLSKDK